MSIELREEGYARSDIVHAGSQAGLVNILNTSDSNRRISGVIRKRLSASTSLIVIGEGVNANVKQEAGTGKPRALCLRILPFLTHIALLKELRHRKMCWHPIRNKRRGRQMVHS